jgi:hypothetical protein
MQRAKILSAPFLKRMAQAKGMERQLTQFQRITEQELFQISAQSFGEIGKIIEKKKTGWGHTREYIILYNLFY